MDLSTVIIEDEPLAAELIAEYIDEIPFLHLVGTFYHANAARSFLMQSDIDVMFLDIHLPKISGLEFITSLPVRPQIILTTAYHQYALKSYEYDVIDYLLKPIEFDRFQKAVMKLNRLKDLNYLLINVNKFHEKIPFEKILYVESKRDYLHIHLLNGSVRKTKMTITAVQDKLPPYFIRIHRSFIVNKRFVSACGASALTVAQHTLPIGRKYKGNAVGAFMV